MPQEDLYGGKFTGSWSGDEPDYSFPDSWSDQGHFSVREDFNPGHLRTVTETGTGKNTLADYLGTKTWESPRW